MNELKSKGFMMHVVNSRSEINTKTFFGFCLNIRIFSEPKPWLSWYVSLELAKATSEYNFILLSCSIINELNFDLICKDIDTMKKLRENGEHIIIIYDKLSIPIPIMDDVDFISEHTNINSFPKNCYLSSRELQINFHFDETFNYSELKPLLTKFTDFESVIKFAHHIKDNRQKYIEPLIGKPAKEAKKMAKKQKDLMKFTSIRVLSHNGIATCDYIPSRLNLYLDINQNVENVTFG
jgi:hypothetical protein